MAENELHLNQSILLPSNMNMSEYEQKIFRKPAASSQLNKMRTVEDVLYLFGTHKGVVGVMLMDRAGKIIRSNYDGPITGMYCGLSKNILDTMTPTIETATILPSPINVIRVNSCAQEVIIAPIAGEDLVFVIVQNLEDRPSVARLTKLGEAEVEKWNNFAPKFEVRPGAGAGAGTGAGVPEAGKVEGSIIPSDK